MHKLLWFGIIIIIIQIPSFILFILPTIDDETRKKSGNKKWKGIGWSVKDQFLTSIEKKESNNSNPVPYSDPQNDSILWN